MGKRSGQTPHQRRETDDKRARENTSYVIRETQAKRSHREPPPQSPENAQTRGAWPAQFVEHVTLDLGVLGSSPTLGGAIP